MIDMTKCVWGFVCAVSLMGLVSVIHVGVSGAAEPRAGAWSGGAAIGFLANTPDGTAFATNVHADYFLNRQVSVGPLAQLAVSNSNACLWDDFLELFFLHKNGINLVMQKVNLPAAFKFAHHCFANNAVTIVGMKSFNAQTFLRWRGNHAKFAQTFHRHTKRARNWRCS